MESVTVIGAGMVGLLTAFELRARGHQVELRSAGVAEAATFAAAGMLAPSAEIQYGQDQLWPLLLAGSDHHQRLAMRLADLTQLPTGYRRSSTLVIGRDHADLADLRDRIRVQQQAGGEVRELSLAQLRSAEPALARTVAGGALLRDDHHVDPRLLAAAVESVLRRDGPDGPAVPIRIGPVRTLADLDADRVVLAAGLGVPAIDGPHQQLDLALRPVRGDILRLRVPPTLLAPGESHLLTRTVRATVRGRLVYLVPRSDDRGPTLVVGATSREDDLTGPSAGGVLQLLHDAAEILPSVRETELVEVTARDRPGTPDDLPVLGPVPGDPRVIVSTGYHRHGILLAPWAAARTADLIDHRLTPTTARQLAAVRPERFTSDPTARTARPSSQEAAPSSR